MSRLIERGVEFDSVFAYNDLSAAGVLRAVGQAGLSVPGDVCVIGFDDFPMAEHTAPPLTTVRQPMRAMGETAARMLLEGLEGLEGLKDSKDLTGAAPTCPHDPARSSRPNWSSATRPEPRRVDRPPRGPARQLTSGASSS